MLNKIISGGQTGVDMAGLYAARQLGFITGGYAPSGWITRKGNNEAEMRMFGMEESTGGYRERTYQNAQSSDATLRLAVDFSTAGEICTFNAIKKYDKTHFDIYLLDMGNKNKLINDVVDWLVEKDVNTLNIAGNTEGTNGYKDIFGMAYRLLVEILTEYKRRINS